MRFWKKQSSSRYNVVAIPQSIRVSFRQSAEYVRALYMRLLRM